MQLTLDRVKQEAARPPTHPNTASAKMETLSTLRGKAIAASSRAPDHAAPREGVLPAVAGCLEEGDCQWASDVAVGAAPFFALFAETNARGVEDGIMDVAVRHRVMHGLGFRMLDFEYIQPPLGESQGACYDLLLLALSHDGFPVAGEAPGALSIPRWQLILFLFDYALSCEETCDFVEKDYWRQMVGSIAPTLPLCSLPWDRKTAPPTNG